jgi:hypothetical protein
VDLHTSFKIGAKQLAHAERLYTDLHKAHGIEETHWLLLTQDEYWTPDQARAIRSILANVVEVSMTIAGMPAIPLPAQYVAAVIAEIVSPCNRILACLKAPDTFDAFDASGLMGNFEVKEVKYEQMVSLVMAYSGGYHGEPPADRLPRSITEAVKKENQAKTKRALN